MNMEETLAKYCTLCPRHCKLYDLAIINNTKQNSIITVTFTCPLPNGSNTTTDNTTND